MPPYKDEIRRLLLRREVGGRPTVGSRNAVYSQLSSSIKTINTWDPRLTVNDTHHGGIFNFGFSADGSLLAAACEKKSVLLFDPHNAKLVSVKNEAHTDCVNCVRFLDSRTFVTCSDDTTVCLWDARHMKHAVRTLRHGHSNWVKNIEYAANQGYLLTSGFDGCIYLWDINKYTEDAVEHRRLFHTSGLMRSKLTPDETKLVVATAGGYLMVVHDLDLQTLHHDLLGFKPNMYRLMQMNQWPTMQAYNYNHLFRAKRNRVEFISDFPSQDDAEMIASLEIHPQGWCAVSRNTSADENTEWTCVHDLQGSVEDVEEVEMGQVEQGSQHSTPASPSKPKTASTNEGPTAQAAAGPCPEVGGQVTQRQGVFQTVSGLLPSQVPSSVRRRFITPVWVPPTQARAPSAASQSVRPADDQESGSDSDNEDGSRSDSLVSTNMESEPESEPSVNLNPTGASSNQARVAHMRLGESVTFVFRPASELEENMSMICDGSSSDAPRSTRHIYRSIPRLTHYIEEPNVGRGFIKEICFSNDGRLLCSPFAFGVRVLAFDGQCQELCDCVPTSPAALHEVTSNISHCNVVVTVGYSPTHSLLVSGCLDGKVDFHQPVL